MCVVFVVLAFAQGGDFHRFLREQPGRRLPDLCAAFYIRQLVEALDFLHKRVGAQLTKPSIVPPGL